MRLQVSLALLYLMLLTACSATHETAITHDSSIDENCFNFDSLSHNDRALADSLLYESLINTGLHTFVSTLKPMSDIVSYRWPVASNDTLDTPSLEFIEEYKQLNRIASSISCGPLRTVITPFKMLFEGERYVQMRVVRTDAIENMLEAYPEFWSRWAFAKGSDPAIIIQVMEYEDSYDRFRGYGYLYGYPAYAVDFFIEAARSQSETGEFVERDFIQMPVVSGRTGMFVYAAPEGHEKNEADLAIKRQANKNVAMFNELAPKYYDEEGSFNSVAFLRDLYIYHELTFISDR
ncbi:MAG: hypothetical protein LAT84_12735 [Balneolia bacterium]|nr:hypothetical protein [Balneolia bacterium]